jgi:tight adherence protein B
MSPTLLVPAIVLGTALAAAPFVLAAEQRERKVQQQIKLTTGLVTSDRASYPGQSIRREKVRFERLRQILESVFSYNPVFPEAYKVPFAGVAAIGCLAGTGAALFSATALSSPLSLGIGVLTTVMTIRGLFGWQRDRYSNSLRKQLPDALQFVVGAVRAGFPVVEAFRGLAREAPQPTSGRFVELLNEISVGRPVAEAMFALYQRTGVTEYSIFAVTLAVQSKSGGHLAETIQTLADTVRERLTLASRARALAGEGIVSATILCVLPVITGLALSLIQPGYLTPLFTDPRGRKLFLIGVGALLAGVWTMRKMIAGAVRE